VGGQPDADGQAGEAAAGVVGVDRGAALGAEHQVQLDRAGWSEGFDEAQRHGRGLAEGEAEAGLLAGLESRTGIGFRRLAWLVGVGGR
jgi:hypothetical protein